MKNSIKIVPSRRGGISTWEVRDNKNKCVGTFDANKDRDGSKYEKLLAITTIRNIANDLFDARQRIKDLIHGKNDWEVSDRALQACTQTKDAISQLDEIITHVKKGKKELTDLTY